MVAVKLDVLLDVPYLISGKLAMDDVFEDNQLSPIALKRVMISCNRT
jgi:hypothetical protein